MFGVAARGRRRSGGARSQWILESDLKETLDQTGDDGLAFLARGGQMGALMRAHPWANTPLGAPEQWSEGLKTTVRLALNTRHPVFIFWGPDGICLYNDAYSALVGPEKHPGMLGMPARQAWGEIWSVIGPQIDLVMAGGGSTWSENELIPIMRNGALEDVYWTYSYGPIHDGAAASGIGGVLVLCTETTEIVRAKRSQDEIAETASFVNEIGEILSRLQDQDSSMQQLVRYCIGAFCDWAVIDLANDSGELVREAWAHREPDHEPALEELATLAPDYHPTQALLRRVHGTGRAELRRVLSASSTDDAPGGLVAEHAGGGVMPGSFVAASLTIRGQSLGVIGFARLGTANPYNSADLELAQEIARRAAVALDNARLFDSLQQADQAKDQFLATLSHELRNPLAPVRHAVDLLAANAERPDLVARTTNMLRRQIGQIVHLVDDLLDISRVNLGKIELRRETVPLRQILDEAIEMTRPVCTEARQQLMLSAPDVDVRVNVDTVRLVQVLGNLINNACKFSEPDNQIDLRAELDGDEVVIRIRDHGIGIAADQMSRLFRLFSQIPAASGQGAGLGIGLALSRSLIDLHGGRIDVFSAGLNQGSEFSVRLPLAPDAVATQADDEPAVGAAVAPALPDKSLRILVVDDNEDAAVSLTMLLEQEGFQAEAAFDGEQALEQLAASAPDVMLLDLGMPGMDGYEVAKRVRASAAGQAIRLIALTGWGQAADKARTRQAQFDGHLVKPVGLDELKAMLASCRP